MAGPLLLHLDQSGKSAERQLLVPILQHGSGIREHPGENPGPHVRAPPLPSAEASRIDRSAEGEEELPTDCVLKEVKDGDEISAA